METRPRSASTDKARQLIKGNRKRTNKAIQLGFPSLFSGQAWSVRSKPHQNGRLPGRQNQRQNVKTCRITRPPGRKSTFAKSFGGGFSPATPLKTRGYCNQKHVFLRVDTTWTFHRTFHRTDIKFNIRSIILNLIKWIKLILWSNALA